MDDKILESLVNMEKILAFGDDFYQQIDNTLSNLNIVLYAIQQKRSYRAAEAKQGKKPISNQQLDLLIDRHIAKIKEMDPEKFYFPSLMKQTKDGQQCFFSDKTAALHIPLVFNGGLIPSNKLTPESIPDVRSCILSIKKIFQVMAQNRSTFLPKAYTNLVWTTQVIYTLVYDYIKEMQQKDIALLQKRIQGQRNKANREKATDNKVDEIRKHALYPDIEKILGKYKGRALQHCKIDDVITKMGIKRVKDEKTIRRYRKMLIRDYLIEKNRVDG